jgi:cell division septum initiation protein DivIVA
MPRRRSVVEQRREQLVAQVEGLRRRLASKTRKDYSSDFQYERWVEQSRALIDELFAELSILDEPGEYDQLPSAVVAEELGTTTAKVRLLIKGGEILASGKPAHEYVSREELAIACETGVEELLRRLEQDAAEVFEESVEYLRQRQPRLAERACGRLVARESVAGAFALPYETALFLAKGELDEVDARLRFIRRAEVAVRARLLRNLSRILQGMSFQDEAVKAIAERLLYEDEVRNEDSRKIFGPKLDELQQLAMLITTAVFDDIERRWKRPLQAGHGEQLYEIIRSTVYSALHAHESYDHLASSREFINAVRVLMPRYYKPVKLINDL